MRTCPTISALLAFVALSCSGSESTPVEVPQECTTPVTVTPEPASTSVPPQSEAQAHFVVSNDCTSSSGPWNLTASGAGAVASVRPPSPSVMTLEAGADLEVIVPLVSGDPGSGTVRLTATHNGSPGRTSSGTQDVTVPSSPPPPPPPPPPPSAGGIPFGPTRLWKTVNTTETIGVSPFSMSLDFTTWSSQEGGRPHILTRIEAARAMGLKLVLTLTGGAHDRYTSNGRFDIEKWKHGNPLYSGSGMDGYDTEPIKTAVAQAVADGVVLGGSLMDEPSREASWGPMTKAVVDEMCAYAKRIFPTLPVGVVAVHWWRPQEHYGVCDFIVSQFEYDVRHGGGKGSETPTAFRDAGLAQAAADGVSIVFSMNILGGGHPGPDCTRDGKECLMTASEVREAGLILGPAGSGLLMWRYEPTIMGQAAYQSAMEDIAADLRTRPVKSWRRR